MLLMYIKNNFFLDFCVFDIIGKLKIQTFWPKTRLVLLEPVTFTCSWHSFLVINLYAI